jgi:hypothetical protein
VHFGVQSGPKQGRTWTSVPLAQQNCCAHQLVCALHWNEQIAPPFIAFFSTAQAPGGSFTACFVAAADAAGTLHGSAAAEMNASVTRIFACD